MPESALELLEDARVKLAEAALLLKQPPVEPPPRIGWTNWG